MFDYLVLSSIILNLLYVIVLFTKAFTYGTIHLRRRHSLGGGGVKNLPNLPTDSSKKLPTVGVKNREKFPDVLNGWSLT